MRAAAHVRRSPYVIARICIYIMIIYACVRTHMRAHTNSFGSGGAICAPEP